MLVVAARPSAQSWELLWVLLREALHVGSVKGFRHFQSKDAMSPVWLRSTRRPMAFSMYEEYRPPSIERTLVDRQQANLAGVVRLDARRAPGALNARSQRRLAV